MRVSVPFLSWIALDTLPPRRRSNVKSPHQIRLNADNSTYGLILFAKFPRSVEHIHPLQIMRLKVDPSGVFQAFTVRAIAMFNDTAPLGRLHDP